MVTRLVLWILRHLGGIVLRADAHDPDLVKQVVRAERARRQALSIEVDLYRRN